MSFDTFPHWTGHLFARSWIRICQNSRISRKENHIGGDCWWILRQAMWNEKQKTNEHSNFCHSSLLWQTFSNWKCLLVFFWWSVGRKVDIWKLLSRKTGNRTSSILPLIRKKHPNCCDVIKLDPILIYKSVVLNFWVRKCNNEL